MKQIRFALRILRNSIAILLLWVVVMIQKREIITPREMWRAIKIVNAMSENVREEVKK